MKTVTINNEKQSLNNVTIGENVKIFNFVNAYGCSIDDGSKVGTFVEIQKGVIIGKNCKISSHSFICEGVQLEDNVFVGHGVMFTNDLFPRAANPDGTLQTESDWKMIETIVKNHIMPPFLLVTSLAVQFHHLILVLLYYYLRHVK